MKDVLTTNKPDLVELYIKGVLTVDFRVRFSKSAVGNKCYFYASAPVQRVIAEATIEDVVKVTRLMPSPNVDHLLKTEWDKKFFKYHFDVSDGYLIKFKDIKRYNTPLTLEDLSVRRVPMSWCYV